MNKPEQPLDKLGEYFSVDDVVSTADNKMLARLSPTAKRQIQDLITQSQNALLDNLKTELREYREKYPDADYNDIMGYIVGFQYRPQLRKDNHAK